MNKLELTSLNCTSCGASLSGYEGKSEIICEYCNTTIKILRPRNIIVNKDNLSVDNFDRLNNYIEILQKAMRAGNYNEGYDYCNKALEVNPSIGSIWENKAICAFWKSISFLNEDKITLSNAREIRTFLNASKENDPTSETYEATADAIGSNLVTILKIKLALITQDSEKTVNKQVIKSYSPRNLSRAKDYLETMETAFEILVNKDLDILKFLVNEYSNLGKFIWWGIKNPLKKAGDISNIKPTPFSQEIGIDVSKKREMLINRIQKIDSSYVAPIIKILNLSGFYWFVIVVVAVAIVLNIVAAVVKNIN